MHEAIDELVNLVGDRQLIDNWAKKWLLSVTHEQNIINKNYINSEYHDFICEHIVSECLNKVLDNNAVRITTNDKSYSVNMICFKNEGKRF